MEQINMLGLLPLLPGDIGDIETKVVLKKLTKAHQALAELKGVAYPVAIPHKSETSQLFSGLNSVSSGV